MFVLWLLMIASIVVPAAIGLAAYRAGWTLPGGGPSVWGRAAAERFGSLRATVAILALGTIAVTVVCLPVGFLAKALEDKVDVPTLAWFINRVRLNHLTTLNNKLTVMGNNGNVQLICLFAGILLAAIWRRNFWAPLLLIVGTFYLERYSQRGLAHIVDRGHPPTTQGTYPSGGVGRLLSIYGLIIVLVVFLLPALTRAWRVGLYTGLGVAAVVEAFTRVYLSKHWLTDAVGGLIFGYLLLIVSATAAAALVTTYGPSGPPPEDAGRHAQEPDVATVPVG